MNGLLACFDWILPSLQQHGFPGLLWRRARRRENEPFA